MLIISLIFIILLVFYYQLKKNYNYWESQGIPYERPILLFGNFLNVVLRKQHTSEIIRDIYFKHSNQPYVGFYGFTKPLLIVRDPDILKMILIKDFNKFPNRNADINATTDKLAIHSIFVLRDNKWRNLRMKLSPVFTSGKIKMMLPLMMECGRNLREIVENSPGIVEIRDLMKLYTVDIISTCAFGINSNCLKDKNTEFNRNALKFVDTSSPIRNFAMLCYFFLPKLIRLFQMKFFDSTSSEYLVEIFKTTLQERQINNIERHDFINLLHKLKKNNNDYNFDDVKMASQAISFFAAGTITTTMTITCSLYELALNKPIQNRLRDEIRQSYETHNGFTYDSINEMKYLHMVVCESLRKHPLTSFASREAVDDYLIEKTGYKIEKGTAIIVPTPGLHIDPKYFPDPNKYDPERFNDENKQNILSCTYMPFGEGPRNCMGQRFGLLSTKIALIQLVKDFEFDVCEKTQIPLRISRESPLVQAEDGVPLKVTRIEQF